MEPPPVLSRAHTRIPTSMSSEAKESTGVSKRARVLVVEDEVLVAFETARVLSEADFEVVGPAISASQALELIATSGCDAAVLDAMLGKETSETVAQELNARGKPFVVFSAYSQEQLPPLLQSAPFVPKPLRPQQLLDELRRCLKA
jgi:DNA-binding NarL/FixJ family response regulator